MHPSLPSPLLTSSTFLPASTHTGLEGMSDTYFHYITLKYIYISVSFLHSPLVLKLLLPFENMNALEWFLYFQRVKVLKSTSLFQGGGEEVNQPASYLKCSLGKSKNDNQRRGQLLQHLDLYLRHLETRAGKQNARHWPLLTSWWCLLPVEPIPLQTTIHDDACLASSNFHSRQYCKVGGPVSTPYHSPPFLQPVPGTPAIPVAS